MAAKLKPRRIFKCCEGLFHGKADVIITKRPYARTFGGILNSTAGY